MKKLIVLSIVIIITSFIYSQTKTDDAKKILQKQNFTIFKSGVKAEDFNLPSINGKNISLSQNLGKVVILNFWATWCPPCKTEMPYLEKLSQKMEGKNFTLIGVDLGEDTKTVSDFIKATKYKFLIAVDQKGITNKFYSTGSIPTTYIIDKKGYLIAFLVGATDWTDNYLMKAYNLLINE